jgi:hypothetical protein
MPRLAGLTTITAQNLTTNTTVSGVIQRAEDAGLRGAYCQVKIYSTGKIIPGVPHPKAPGGNLNALVGKPVMLQMIGGRWTILST